MNLVVTLEYRFDRTPDGSVWTLTAFPREFWDRYLAVFDTVRLVARVHDVSSVSAGWKRVDGECVSFAAVPHYLGPGQFIPKARTVVRAVQSAVTPADAVIMRVPSHLASVLTSFLSRTYHPYGVEVVGDPYDAFAPGAVRHPLRLFFRWLFTRQLKWQCSHACGAAYVTQCILQRRYPPGTVTFATYYTDGVLTDEDYISLPRALCVKKDPFSLVTVASLAQPYKGIDVLIDAVAICVRDGVDLSLTIVGDGKYRSELEKRTAAYGLGEQVRFLGQLPGGAPVRAQLDAADLFVMPSRTEGLPRVVIEAMARGLPCIGSAVGGIPELLPSEDLVPPDDARALASKIMEVINDPSRMARMSKRGVAKALEYHDDVMRERRLALYRHVKETTERWQKTGGIR
jgi:glycosyltransferase involved in cell wall biosynthesis